MLKLLINSLAKEFYQQHAGFFLFAIYVLFGIVEPRQVIEFNSALLLSGISSLPGMMLVFILWGLYGLKAWFFIRAKLRLPQYNFIKEIGSLKKQDQLRLWLKLYSIILLPVIVYVILLLWLSMQHQLYFSLVSILSAFSALLFGLAWFSFRSISFSFLKQERLQLFIMPGFKKPFFSWPLYYLFQEQLLALFMCKVLSLFLFKGILWMFADVAIDVRTLLIALLASILCHSVLVFNLLKFETEYLSFAKSLPLRVITRFINWLLVFMLVLIPEWVFFSIAAHYNLYSVIDGLLFGTGGLFFFLILLYAVKLDMESYLKMLLLFFFIAIWAILAQYYLMLSIAMLGFSLLNYFLRFDKIDLRGIE
jgi:hypothetical protein